MNELPGKTMAAFKLLPLDQPVYGAFIANEQWISNLVSLGGLDEYHLFCAENDREGAAQRYAGVRARVFAWEQLPECLRRNEYVTVQCFGVQPSQLYLLRSALGIERCPVCTITHSISYPQVLTAMLVNLLTCDRNCDTFICGTAASRTALVNIMSRVPQQVHRDDVRLGPDSVHVIPHGIDCEYYANRPDRRSCRRRLSLPEDSLVILSTGRISFDDKIDYECLIEAFAILLTKCPEQRKIILYIAGDDRHGHSRRLFESAARHGVAGQMRVYPGFPDDCKRILYGAADIFVSLSNSVQESFGLTILEAMASGLPVIATDWNGYRHLVDPGVNGFLVSTSWRSEEMHAATLLSPIVPWEKTHASLAKAVRIDPGETAAVMRQVMENADLRKRVGDAAQKTSRRYDWRQVVPALERHWMNMYRQSGRTGTERRRDRPFFFDYSEIFGHYASGSQRG